MAKCPNQGLDSLIDTAPLRCKNMSMGKVRPNRGQNSGQNSGQISVLAALMIGTTFFLFLAFVINTGMVVHAKINLQNAADVAAYAGASTQARQLNQIGVLNYELRRQYKKFIFRYNVLGTLAATQASGSGPVAWGPGPARNQGVPAVCVTFRSDDNYCQLSTLPRISSPSPSFLDAIGQALKNVLDQIEQLRQQNCAQIGNTNLALLYLWLYKTEPETSSLLAGGGSGSPEDIRIFQTLSDLTRGLGLVPKNILLKKRIDSLAGFVNYPGANGLTLAKTQELEGGGDSFARERPIQAFYSAYNTLGPKVFDTDSIVMDELLPSSPMLKLKTVYGEFDAYATQQEIVGSGCEQHWVNLPVKGRTLPLGVSKEPSPLVYYAVRLKARARVLLSPFGDIEMTAYSAAKPFGSRIGPDTTPEDWVRPATPGFLPHSSNGANQSLGKVPNLAVVAPNEGVGRGKGWDSSDIYNAARTALTQNAPGQPSGGTLTTTVVEKVMRAAMAPNPSEKGRYLIPADFRTQNFTKNESFDFFGSDGGKYAFYAPLKDKETPGGDPRQEVEDALSSVVLPPGMSGAATLLNNGLFQYFGRLRSPQGGDEEESFSFARVSDPLHLPTGEKVQLGSALMTDADSLRSSWGGAALGPERTSGRIGYSVKLVSFQHLRNQGLSIDPETETVIDFIQH